MAYIVKADVESLLDAFSIPAHWTASSDAYLNSAIARATQLIDAYTRNHFEPISKTLILSGDGCEVLCTTQVTALPIVSISAIRYREEPSYDFDTAGELVAATEYTISNTRRSIIRHGNTNTIRGGDGSALRWARGYFNYRVAGTFGYPSVPAVIKKAAVLLVREEISPGYMQRMETLQSESFPDGYSYSKPAVSSTAESYGITTGYRYVDRLLTPFIYKRNFSAHWF